MIASMSTEPNPVSWRRAKETMSFGNGESVPVTLAEDSFDGLTHRVEMPVPTL